MAKDEHGHGSDGTGRTQMPFGKRQSIPRLPAHQSRVAGLIKDFAANKSGEGHIPHVLEEFDLRDRNPGETARIGKEVSSALADGRLDLHALVHFAHFLTVLGALAVIDLLALGLTHG